MAHVKPQFTKGQVDRSGSVLIRADVSEDEMSAALSVMNNWRTAHSYPLEAALQIARRGATRINPKVIIAERLKRRPSIASKLAREPNMKLSQMQDIGGCRAVFRSIDEVNEFVRLYARDLESETFSHFRKTDYIQAPKVKGYRGLHLVWRYKSRDSSTQEYDGMRVEIQIRSALQHAWATAVEMASTFSREDLKFGTSDSGWSRFFALMGSAIALAENTPIVPGTPGNKMELIRELKRLSDELKVEGSLKRWSELTTIRNVTSSEAARMFLVTLQPNDYRWQLKVMSFSESDTARAADEYLRAEKENAEKRGVQVALVSVESIDMLRQAYPNYYMDTSEFLKVLQTVLYGSLDPLVYGLR